jgi:hypothetical protein
MTPSLPRSGDARASVSRLPKIRFWWRADALGAFSTSRGDQRQAAEFVGAMVIGSIASFVFVLACWFGLRREWGSSITSRLPQRSGS